MGVAEERSRWLGTRRAVLVLQDANMKDRQQDARLACRTQGGMAQANSCQEQAKPPTVVQPVANKVVSLAAAAAVAGAAVVVAAAAGAGGCSRLGQLVFMVWEHQVPANRGEKE